MKITNFLTPSLKEGFYILIGITLLMIVSKVIDFGESISLIKNTEDYNSTKFIFNFPNERTIVVDDKHSLVYELYFNKMIQRLDIQIFIKNKLRIVSLHNIYIDNSYSKVDLKTQKLELRTKTREFGLASNKSVYGVGTQVFGIMKANTYHFQVNKDGYFIGVDNK